MHTLSSHTRLLVTTKSSAADRSSLPPVEDTNNASTGDLMLLAAQCWSHEPTFLLVYITKTLIHSERPVCVCLCVFNQWLPVAVGPRALKTHLCRNWLELLSQILL